MKSYEVSRQKTPLFLIRGNFLLRRRCGARRGGTQANWIFANLRISDSSSSRERRTLFLLRNCPLARVFARLFGLFFADLLSDCLQSALGRHCPALAPPRNQRRGDRQTSLRCESSTDQKYFLSLSHCCPSYLLLAEELG